MKNEMTIEKVKDGVEIQIKGEVKFTEVKEMVQSCQEGTCGCPSEMLDKIDGIAINGKDGEVYIGLKGDALSVDNIEQCMQGGACCGF